jgi:hypothetical protein
MYIVSYKKNNFKLGGYVSFVQVVLIWFYLFGNIQNRSEGGVGLPFLIIYFFFGGLIVFFGKYPKLPSVKKVTLIFLLFVLWISIRYLIDRNGFEDLRQATIATTGGVILFYVIGSILRKSLEMLQYMYHKFFMSLIFVYTAFVTWLLFDYSDKVMLDNFLLNDVDQDYQRPGNFMSIGYLIISYLYVFSAISRKATGAGFPGLFLALYSLDTFLLLMSSQLLGSNSAAVVVAGIYSLSMIFVISTNERLIVDFYGGKIKKSLIWKYFNSGFRNLSVFFVVLLFFALIFVVGLDLDWKKFRVLNFDEDGGGSLNSRLDILVRWGLEQISYAPLFGNLDVAYYVTGDSGITLHNFLPNVLASLGLVGLLMVFILLYCIFNQHFLLIVKDLNGEKPIIFIAKSISIYSLEVILFIFLIANISVGFSWAVFWFVIGFLGSLIGFAEEKEFGSWKITHD